jgi:hypothetical protein
MILDNPDLWDAASIAAVLAYNGGPKQAWDNTDLAGPWLNEMRNSINTQIWSFKECFDPDARSAAVAAVAAQPRGAPGSAALAPDERRAARR